MSQHPALGDVAGQVGRAVVDDDQLEVGVLAGGDRVERLDEQLGLVVRGDDHRDPRRRRAEPVRLVADDGLGGRLAGEGALELRDAAAQGDRLEPGLLRDPRHRLDQLLASLDRRLEDLAQAPLRRRDRQPGPAPEHARAAAARPRRDPLGGLGEHRGALSQRQPLADESVGVGADPLEALGRIEQLVGQQREVLGVSGDEVGAGHERGEMRGALADHHGAAVDRLEHADPFEVRWKLLPVDVEQQLRAAEQRPLVLAGEEAGARGGVGRVVVGDHQLAAAPRQDRRVARRGCARGGAWRSP